MNNREAILEKYNFDPADIVQTENYVDWYERGSDEKHYGLIIVIKIGKKWYCLSEYLDCTAGTLPEHEYRYNKQTSKWKLFEKKETEKQGKTEKEAEEEGARAGNEAARLTAIDLVSEKRIGELLKMWQSPEVLGRILEERQILTDKRIRKADEDTREEIRCIRKTHSGSENERVNANWLICGYLDAVDHGKKKQAARKYAKGFCVGAEDVFFHLYIMARAGQYQEFHDYLFPQKK